MTPAIEIQQVNHFYGRGENKVQVLFDNNLTINAGEIVIITGPSGSGKTTLLTLIGGLRSLQDGSLKIKGKELRGLRAPEQVKVRRDIGFIFQAHNLFESLTAYQNVKIASELHSYPPGEAKERSEAVLCALKLGDHLHKKPQQLSGGQRQRVAIGRALVNQPKLILADEPTSALDRETSLLVIEMLQKMAQTSQTSVMIVTHDPRLLDAADRIVRIVDGCIESNVEVAESMELANVLKSCPIFKDFVTPLIVDVSSKIVQEHYPAGSTVIRQGEVGDKFYFIRSGRVEVFKETAGTQEFVSHLGPGDFFGEMALLKDEPRAATVRVVEAIDCLTLAKRPFRLAVEASADFESQLKKEYFHR